MYDHFPTDYAWIEYVLRTQIGGMILGAALTNDAAGIGQPNEPAVWNCTYINKEQMFEDTGGTHINEVGARVTVYLDTVLQFKPSPMDDMTDAITATSAT